MHKDAITIAGTSRYLCLELSVKKRKEIQLAQLIKIDK